MLGRRIVVHCPTWLGRTSSGENNKIDGKNVLGRGARGEAMYVVCKSGRAWPYCRRCNQHDEQGNTSTVVLVGLGTQVPIYHAISNEQWFGFQLQSQTMFETRCIHQHVEIPTLRGQLLGGFETCNTNVYKTHRVQRLVWHESEHFVESFTDFPSPY